MTRTKVTFTVFWVLTLTIFASVSFAQPNLAEIYKNAKATKGKRPVILIPGIMGSELVHKDTGEKLWFSFSRSDNEDLRLPIALNLRLSTDKLIPGDVLREVDLRILPDIKFYQGLIETLTKYGGYEEASWDNPPKNLEDKFFVFPYDWRRDNVETAQYLLEEIRALKRKTKRPNIKFNVLAHSMGGLIVRYAAMYGMADLPEGRPKPTWAGEKYFAKIFFLGTPNEGTANAFETLLRGRSSLGGTTKLPFVRHLTPLDVATMPAVFQLLPHQGTARFYDENLNPIKIDIFDVKNWEKYGWAVYTKEKHLKEFTDAERGRFEQYFELVLKRARKFQSALNVYSKRRLSVGLKLVGSDCSDTLNGLVVYKNPKNGKWVTITRPRSFKNSKGVKISSQQLKKIMLAPGDGSVTRRSLLAETLAERRGRNPLFDSAQPLNSALFVCEAHEQLTNNSTVQNNILIALLSDAKQ